MFYALLKWNTSTWDEIHMAVAASQFLAIFYVKQPDGQQVVQSNKDVIQMPTLAVCNRNLKPSICSEFTQNKAAEIGMPQGFLDFARQGILENDESNYVFTYSGFNGMYVA